MSIVSTHTVVERDARTVELLLHEPLGVTIVAGDANSMAVVEMTADELRLLAKTATHLAEALA